MEDIRTSKTAQDDALIRLTGLTKSFGAKRALSGIDLEVGRGKIVGLLGPNGSGKTTLIKILNGLLRPTSGVALIDGHAPGVETKSHVSYLPDRMYFADWMKAADLMDLFSDFYADFDRQKAAEMFSALGIRPMERIKTMSKGTKEKVQLVLVMSRQAELYLLDEPIAGVDPAARDFILNTILTNYNENGTVLISTHLIADIERVLDEVIFLQNGQIVRHDSVDNIRATEGKSVDQLFREIFRAVPYQGGDL
ncbi:MAG TPA: ABC transporter ATP-binding protein [Candidatus Butyricicoccus avicola]|nr:ABC transporter ATP-binding protein [Candidatus Butyricicoccus avicola]